MGALRTSELIIANLESTQLGFHSHSRERKVIGCHAHYKSHLVQGFHVFQLIS